MQIMTMKPRFVSIGLSLALCVACGGTSDGGNGSPGGGAGSAPVGAGGSGSPGGSSAGGSGPGGSGPGGSSAGGAPSGTGDFSSGIAGNQQLGSLSDSEIQGLCKKVGDYFSSGSAAVDVQELTCRFESAFGASFSGATTDAALQAACKTLYDQCIAAPTTTTETCNKPDAGCTATVAEYEACVNDTATSLSTVTKALPACDELTMASLGDLGSGAATDSPASCTSVKAKCPTAPLPPGAAD